MQFDFSEAMAERTNSELIAITTTDRDKYQPEALVAAEQELSKRNLSVSQLEKASAQNEVKQQQDSWKSNIPLDLHWKILSVFLPAVILFIVVYFFKSDGFVRKAKELTIWTIVMFGVYTLAVIILSA